MDTSASAAAAAQCDEHGRTVVRVAGDIDASTQSTLNRALDHAEGGHVVIDLSRVGFMDSAGLKVLLHHRSRLARDGRTLALRRARPPVRRLLEVGGASDLLVDA